MTNATYQTIPIKECGEPLRDLSKYTFLLSPQYFSLGLADSPKMYSREGVIEKLLKVVNHLDGLNLKIWDPWRARSTQNNIYQKCWNDLKAKHPEWNEERLSLEVGVFVTAANDLKRIPPHTTGGAIDLTLVDRSGRELDMGAGFDHFGPEASMFYFDRVVPNNAISSNRQLLREAMVEEGFTYYEDEWWHFDFGNQFWAYQSAKAVAIYGEAYPPKEDV